MTGTGGAAPADRAGTEADMGAQHGDGGTGHRPGHHGTPQTEALLAAALRRDHADDEGERRAVAAFRTARETEPGRVARTRRRDDWRPRERRRAGRPLKTALSVLLASLTLGGVAYAAIGAGGSAADGARPHGPRPSATTETGGGGEGAGGGNGTEVRPVPTPRPASTAPDASVPSGRPASARGSEAACRAFQRLDGRGKALDAAVWERLVAAAGGEEKVAGHCAEVRAAQARKDATDGRVPPTVTVPPEPSRGPADGSGAARGNGQTDGNGQGGGGNDQGGGGNDQGGGNGREAGDGTAGGSAAGRADRAPGTEG
ncbi:hypothetical protein [Streptomyces sp. M92]|uniref:hypothetical protein n=1 Tax=Streptomyces sp. M92 TaxID=2944250 RepID=UPI00234B9AC2|nr:hypothetical protein [Streptomyces sp. M92]WCN02858.1 hypothetical protein M6G08_12615 [Streptomyces sp. M92]